MIKDIREIFPHKIYLVESDRDSTVLIAVDLTRQGDFLSWFDTRKDRAMEVKKIIKDEDDIFSFIRKDGEGETYTFTPMTLEIYNAKVKDKLFNPKEIKDMKSLEEAFTGPDRKY